jgi:hypothetical protein
MRAFFATFVLGGVVFYGAASWAATGATLEPVQGDLWINHGKGFEKVDKRLEAKVGDSVMVSPGGIGKVTYADGCQANVKPGTVTTIAPLSPCASGSLAADMNPPIYTKAPAAAPVAPYDWGWWPWLLIPAAGAAVGGCAIAGCFNSGGSPPQLYEAPSP